jgi:hypothetical protein
VLLGVTNLHYAIHTLGLMDLLRSGVVPGADEENFWNILDNTYVDDVSADLYRPMFGSFGHCSSAACSYSMSQCVSGSTQCKSLFKSSARIGALRDFR